MLLEVIFQLCNYKTQEGIQQNNNILSTKYKAFKHLSMHFYLLFEISYKNVKKTRCSATDEWLRVFRIKMAKEMATFVAELGYWRAQFRSKDEEYLYYYILLYPTCQWSIGLYSIIYLVIEMRPLKEKISITIDSDLLLKLRYEAELDDRSLSQYINYVLKEYMRKKEVGKKPPEHPGV